MAEADKSKGKPKDDTEEMFTKLKHYMDAKAVEKYLVHMAADDEEGHRHHHHGLGTSGASLYGRKSHSFTGSQRENPTTIIPPLGPQKTLVLCGYCAQTNMTDINTRLSYGSFLYCATVVAVGIGCTYFLDCMFFSRHMQSEQIALAFLYFAFTFFGCVILPAIFLLSHKFVDIEHRCPHCKNYLGKYRSF